MATKAKFYIATSSGWVEADFGGSGNGSFYGVCNTAAGTSAKTVTGVENFPTTLESGCSINIKFQYANTTTVNLTLNINNTGAKTIYRNGTSADATWNSGAIINFVYDGTNWIMTDASSRNTDTNYYHTTGQWNGLTYTATAHGSVGDLSLTLPTGTDSTTVSRGDHTHDSRYYTETEINNLLKEKADTDDIPTTTKQLTNDSGFITGQDVNQIVDNEYKPYWADQDTTYTKTEVDNLLATYIKQDTEATATTIGGVYIKLSNGILYISTTKMTS